MRIRLVLAVLLFPLVAPAHAETASAWNDHPNSRVRLVAGEGRMLGVEVVLAPGWKTYWRMPGDAGVPPSFDWAGSDNIGSADVMYPVPVAMADAAGVAVGYKGTVLFPVRITPASEARPTTVRLEFSYGVCKDICIPVDSKLALDLPADPRAIGPAPQIKSALARVPRVVEDAARTEPALTAAKVRVSGAAPGLTLETRGAADVFVEAPDGLFVPMPRKVKEAGAAAVFEIDLSKSPDLKDLIGKPLRVTLATPTGGIETTVMLKE